MNDYIDIDNIRPGDTYRCGKACIEIVRVSTLMEHFDIRVTATGNVYRHIRARDLHKLLNSAEEIA